MKKKPLLFSLFLIVSILVLATVGFVVAKYVTTLEDAPVTVVIDGRTYVVAPKNVFKDNEGKSYTRSADGTITVSKFFYIENLTGGGTWYVNRNIYSDVFKEDTTITAVVLPDSIKTIEYRAFYECASLKTVSVQDGLETIANQAFFGCSSLTSFTMPDSVTSLGIRVFSNCEKLTEAHLSTQLTVIPEETFYLCYALTTVNIENSVTVIGPRAFKGCHALPEIHLPESLEELQSEAFLECKSATTLTLPNRAIICGGNVFGSTGIVSLTVPGNFVLGVNQFKQCPNLESVVLEEGIEVLPDGVFRNCQKLTSITFPSTSLKTIGSGALAGMGTIFPLTIPDSVTEISPTTFDSSNGGDTKTICYNGTATINGGLGLLRHLIFNTEYFGWQPKYETGKLGESNTVFSIPETEDYEGTQLLLEAGTIENGEFVCRDKILVDIVQTNGKKTFTIPKDFAQNGDVLVISPPKYYSYALLDGEKTLHLYADMETYPTAEELSASNSTLYNLPTPIRGNASVPGATAYDSAAKNAVKVIVETPMAPNSMASWFNGFGQCTEIDLTKLDTTKVTSMSRLFYGCSKLQTINISESGFPTPNVTAMDRMFYNCTVLPTISEILTAEGFDTSKVTTMDWMFWSCRGATTIDVSKFDTANVTTMKSMFQECHTLTYLDVSHFDTSKVKTMEGMFKYLYQQNTYPGYLELHLFNITNPNKTNVSSMFTNSARIQKIFVSSDWTNENMSNASGIFSGCSNLVGGDGTTLAIVRDIDSANYTSATYARIDGGSEHSGYFTYYKYALVFDANGGTGAPPDVMLSENGVFENLPNGAGMESNGYPLLGWATTEGATEVAYRPGSTFTNSGTEVPCCDKLYAVYDKPEIVTTQTDLEKAVNSGKDCIVEGGTYKHIDMSYNAVNITINKAEFTGYVDFSSNKTIMVNELEASFNSTPVFIIGSGTEMTIINATITGSGTSAVVTMSSGATLTIEGGTYTRSNFVFIGHANSKLIINGGTFTNITSYGGLAGDVGDVTITGGTFGFDPSGYIPATHTVVDNGNGTWTVQ